MNVKILSPDRLVKEVTTNELYVPGSQGFLTILPGHTKLVSELGSGMLQVEPSSEGESFFVSGGYLEVDSDQVVVIADVVETKKEIDAARAEASKERAIQRLSGIEEGTLDLDRATRSLKRAEARLEFVALG